MYLRNIFAVLAAAVVLSGVPALAHEFIVKPAKTMVKVGEKDAFSVVSAHVFMVSEELEDAGDVKVTRWDASGSVDIPLTVNQSAFSYEGQAVFSKPGTAMLIGYRLPQVWTKTPDGMKKGTKADFPGASVSNIYEKFAKALIVVDAADDGWKHIAGQKLEIMPLSNPADYAPGQDVRFQVLFDGKPQAAEVTATYDGFTQTPNTYAYFTETDDKGVATVRLTSKGLWMVRVQHGTPGKDGIASHMLRSVLVFGVN